MCAIVWCYTGGPRKAAQALKPAREFLKPALDLVGPLPYPALQSMFDGLYPPGLQWYWKANFVKTLTDEAVRLNVEHGAKLPTMHSTMHMYPISGAAARPGASDTAWNYRDANWAQVIVAVDPDPGKKDVLIEWARNYWNALQPVSMGGGYVNFMMDEGAAGVAASYRGNYERLAKIKAKYDPDELFPREPEHQACGYRRLVALRAARVAYHHGADAAQTSIPLRPDARAGARGLRASQAAPCVGVGRRVGRHRHAGDLRRRPVADARQRRTAEALRRQLLRRAPAVPADPAAQSARAPGVRDLAAGASADTGLLPAPAGRRARQSRTSAPDDALRVRRVAAPADAEGAGAPAADRAYPPRGRGPVARVPDGVQLHAPRAEAFGAARHPTQRPRSVARAPGIEIGQPARLQGGRHRDARRHRRHPVSRRSR